MKETHLVNSSKACSSMLSECAETDDKGCLSSAFPKAVCYLLMSLIIFVGGMALVVHAQSGAVEEDGVVPAQNQKIKQGTKLRGKCQWPAPFPGIAFDDKTSNPSDFVKPGTKHRSDSVTSEFISLFGTGAKYGGTYWALGDSIEEMKNEVYKCHTTPSPLVLLPGRYRMAVTREVYDATSSNIYGWVAGEKTLTVENVDFEVTGCDITAKDPNSGRSLSANDLKGFGFDPDNSNQTFTTGPGQRLEVTLKDGTTVRLGPNSSAELDPCEEFKPESRISVKVILGTVWFQVTKALTGDKDFEVDTERAHTGVRGTTFEVSYNSQQELTTVRVTEGTVSFGDINRVSSIMVTAGQSAQLKGEGAPTLVSSTPNGVRKTPTGQRKP